MANTKKPIVLIALAQDKTGTHGYLKALENEKNSIKAALQEAVEKGWIELIIEESATIDDIFAKFGDQKYKNRIAIFHYAGHASNKGLLLETEAGEVTVAHADGLNQFFAQQENLQLVFLNGCTTHGQAKPLLKGKIQNVIASNKSIDDDAALIFATQFYKSLAERKKVKGAYKDAEARVLTEKGGADNTRALYFKKTPKDVLDSGKFPWELATNYKRGKWRLTDLVPIEIFIAQDEKDQDLLNEKLMIFLKPLQRRGLITAIHQKSIQFGVDVEEAIFEAAEQAHIVLFFITPNFLAGDLSYELMESAMERFQQERDVVIIPLLIRKSDIKGSEFTKLMPLPMNNKFVNEWGDDDTAYTHIVEKLREVITVVRQKMGLE